MMLVTTEKFYYKDWNMITGPEVKIFCQLSFKSMTINPISYNNIIFAIL